MNLTNDVDEKTSKPLQGWYLKSGEQVSPSLLKALKDINQKYSKNKLFPEYFRALQQLFQSKAPSSQNRETFFFLGGFLEGEGSLNVGAKKNQESAFRVYLDPEFSVAQHLNGISSLILAMSVFQTGRVRCKTGSNATFVYTIDNRLSLEEKVVPFYEKFVIPYGSHVKKKRLQRFKQLLKLFREKAHNNLPRMLTEVLPLWDALRMQQGQSNETFSNLHTAQMYVEEAASKNRSRKKVSSETIRHPDLNTTGFSKKPSSTSQNIERS